MPSLYLTVTSELMYIMGDADAVWTDKAMQILQRLERKKNTVNLMGVSVLISRQSDATSSSPEKDRSCTYCLTGRRIKLLTEVDTMKTY